MRGSPARLSVDGVSSLGARWQRLSTRAKVIVAVAIALPFVVAAVVYMVNSDGITVVDPENPTYYSYIWVFVLIALDAVMPIFPGETTLNAAATLAANGKLELGPIIVMGALGAIVGDSSLFWIARKSARRIEGQVARAKANRSVSQAFDLLDSSAPVLIIGGRYLPGMRFVVNGSMGLSDIAYRRFLVWSVISGTLWSTYTSVLAYEIGLALGDYPLASFVISGLVTTVAIAAIIYTVRRNRRARARAALTEADGSPAAEEAPDTPPA
jgi:membrane protein DedA with SNARE-associated domain